MWKWVFYVIPSISSARKKIPLLSNLGTLPQSDGRVETIVTLILQHRRMIVVALRSICGTSSFVWWRYLHFILWSHVHTRIEREWCETFLRTHVIISISVICMANNNFGERGNVIIESVRSLRRMPGSNPHLATLFEYHFKYKTFDMWHCSRNHGCADLQAGNFVRQGQVRRLHQPDVWSWRWPCATCHLAATGENTQTEVWEWQERITAHAVEKLRKLHLHCKQHRRQRQSGV